MEVVNTNVWSTYGYLLMLMLGSGMMMYIVFSDVSTVLVLLLPSSIDGYACNILSISIGIIGGLGYGTGIVRMIILRRAGCLFCGSTGGRPLTAMNDCCRCCSGFCEGSGSLIWVWRMFGFVLPAMKNYVYAGMHSFPSYPIYSIFNYYLKEININPILSIQSQPHIPTNPIFTFIFTSSSPFHLQYAIYPILNISTFS